MKLAPFNPSGLYKTDAQTLSYLGNRNSDWWRECEEGGWYEGKPLRSDKMTAPKMSICQWEMKRSPVGICYRRQWQPVWKISSKSFSMASLIHEIKIIFFSHSCTVRNVRGASPLKKTILTKGGLMEWDVQRALNAGRTGHPRSTASCVSLPNRPTTWPRPWMFTEGATRTKRGGDNKMEVMMTGDGGMREN